MVDTTTSEDTVTQARVMTINKASRYMRFMEWTYGSEIPEELSFCGLFWCTLLAPFVALGRLVGRGIETTWHSTGSLPARAEHLGERIATKGQEHPKVGKVLQVLVMTVMTLYLVGITIVGIVALAETEAWWVLLVPANAAWIAYALWRLRHTQPGRVLADGYHAVKTRTCPQIELVDDSKAHA